MDGHGTQWGYGYSGDNVYGCLSDREDVNGHGTVSDTLMYDGTPTVYVCPYLG